MIAATFMNREIGILQRVFKKIVAEKWFNRSPENERDFANFIARTFTQGIDDEVTLQLVAEAAGRHRFSKNRSAGFAELNASSSEAAYVSAKEAMK